MIKLTKDQLAFFERYNISLSRVFDATGMSRSRYSKRMTDLDYAVAVGVTPCSRAGHTIRKRSGHCVQCSPENLAYEARYNAHAEVYVARSAKDNLTKIGLASSARQRVHQLNYYRYGGSDDWKLHHKSLCEHAGRVEYEAHKSLNSFRVDGSYFKNGADVLCQEIFSCSLAEAVSAVEKAAGIKTTQVEQRDPEKQSPRSIRNAFTVEKFAMELRLSVELLLTQLRAAGVDKSAAVDVITEQDKARLLDYLSKKHRAVNVVMPSQKPLPAPEIERRASKTAIAVPLLRGATSPTMPVRMLSNAKVYEGRELRHMAKYARNIVEALPSLTLRELHEQLKLDETKGKVTYPFVWWIDVGCPPTQRAIHEDAEGRFFVKLDNKWQLAYSIDHVGALAGAQSGNGYYDIPKTGYFVTWENEDKAARRS